MTYLDEYVYFIGVGDYLKVGLSQNPERRFKNLFSSSTTYSAPWDCPKSRADRTLLGFVAGDMSHEQAAHNALRMFAVGCEFFLAEPDALDYVERCLTKGRVLEALVQRAEGQAKRSTQTAPPLSAENEAASFARARAYISGLTGGAA